jgi:hypothetical protein
LTNFLAMVRSRLWSVRRNSATVTQADQRREALLVADLPEEVTINYEAQSAPTEPRDVDFDEEWYLLRYPDVALANKERPGSSALAHYLAHGQKEGRLPKPPIGRDLGRSFLNPQNAKLMEGFCSLGMNCEFGEAQRQCGAEPIDLLRWAHAPLPVLLRLLDERFEGIADGIEISPSETGTYMVVSSKYNFKWHSWAREGQILPQQVYEREVKRLPRVAEFLIETLTEGNRIFVRTSIGGETLADASRIASAIKRYGPGQLLFIEENPAQAGIVRRQTDGMLLGYIDKFADTGNVPRTTDVGSWLTICRNALALAA